MFPNRPRIFQLKPLASLRLTDPMIEFQQEGKEHHRRIFLLLHIIYRTTWASNVAPYMFCRIHLYMSFVVHTLQRGLLPPPFVILPYSTCILQPPPGLASNDCSSTTCAAVRVVAPVIALRPLSICRSSCHGVPSAAHVGPLGCV